MKIPRILYEIKDTFTELWNDFLGPLLIAMSFILGTILILFIAVDYFTTPSSEFFDRCNKFPSTYECQYYLKRGCK